MNLITHKPISRRTLLRGAGAAIALPLLEAMFPSDVRAQFKSAGTSSGAHPRMICCYIPNGVNITEWLPQDSGPNWTLSPTLQELAEHKSDFTLISGVGHPKSGGHDGADTWLTGADLDATTGKDYQNSISVDQLAAEHHAKETRFPSLELSCDGGSGQAGHSHTLAFDRLGTPLPSENKPQRLFDRLFVPDNDASRRTTLRRYEERRSILDDVLEEARSLHKRLGKSDQRKLDEYLGSVRETERRVQRLEGWVDVPKPKVERGSLKLSAVPGNAHDRHMWLDVMLELSYLALQTDTTRVITFEWSREAGGLGGNGENHHELSHHGGNPEMLKKLAVIDRFHVGRLARFLSLLKATREADGNMLDNTMVLFGSGMNSGKGGGHSKKNLPILLAGGRKLGLRHGQHLKFQIDSTPLSNVLVSMLQKMGVQQDRFHDSTGTLTGLV